MEARVGLALGLVLFLTICSLPLIPIQVDVTHLTAEYYSFDQELIRERQVRPFPWFWEETQVQYLITNHDLDDGKFTINYLFDNGSDSRTRSKKVNVPAGERVTVTINSPLPGKSDVSVNIVPPYRIKATQETITKNVSVWHFCNPLLWFR